jgi:hypothetical protein
VPFKPDKKEEPEQPEKKELKTQEMILADTEDTVDATGIKLKYTSPSFIEGIPVLAKTMFNEKIVFVFWSKSDDKPYPGKGKGEELPADKKEEYADLHKIIGWRKMLSNFWIQPFELHGKKWNTVEHYYQASKFRLGNPKFYDKFSLDSKSSICENPAMAKSAGGKSGLFEKVRIRPKEILIDPDFFESKRSEEEMYLAQYAKFTNKEALRLGEDKPYLMEMLLNTKEAKLVHTVSRQTEKVVFMNLMIIRDLLKTGKI